MTGAVCPTRVVSTTCKLFEEEEEEEEEWEEKEEEEEEEEEEGAKNNLIIEFLLLSSFIMQIMAIPYYPSQYNNYVHSCMCRSA